MPTFKAEVYAHQKKKDGTYNVKIRITHNTKKKYLSTIWFVEKKDIAKSGKSSFKLKNQVYIDYTDNLIRKYRGICDEIGEPLKNMSIEEVVRILESGGINEFDLDFTKFILEEVDDLIQKGRIGSSNTLLNSLHSLQKFARKEVVMISEIKTSFLANFVQWLVEKEKLKASSISAIVGRLKMAHNLARKEYNDMDAGIMRIPNTPFTHLELPRAEQTRKRAIEAKSIYAIRELEYKKGNKHKNNSFNIAKDTFLLSFVLCGMNAVDLYNCTEYKDGRITYNRTKTKGRRADRAEISIKVDSRFRWLIDKYRDKSGKRVFSFYKMYSSVKALNASLNRGLKVIGDILGIDDLEFYSARHSWATIAINDIGIDKYTVHEALNHSDPSMKITEIYIKKSWKHIDEANAKVLDFVFGK